MVPVNGIYKVFHDTHRAPHEVVLMRGEKFPPCAKCNDRVLFVLVHPARTDSHGQALPVYESSSLEDEEADAGESAG